jgi:hypothetical protein
MPTEDKLKERAQTRLAEFDALLRPGRIFCHYKGGLYSIVCTSADEETHELLVTYHSNKKGGNTTRTVDKFMAWVDYEGEKVPRFTIVEA